MEVAPASSKVRQRFEEAYRELWEKDANASANGSRDGADSAGVQLAMSELQKLSKRLRLGIKFNELDAECQQTRE